MDDLEFLTPEEKRAIATLKRLEKTWPRTLWLYSAAGTLNVMKTGEDGKKVMIPGAGSGFDPNASVATIKIENEGGDW